MKEKRHTVAEDRFWCFRRYRKMNSTVASFFLQSVTETDVVNLLHSLDSSKSTGLHQILLKYLKLATTVVACILTDMFN